MTAIACAEEAQGQHPAGPKSPDRQANDCMVEKNARPLGFQLLLLLSSSFLLLLFINDRPQFQNIMSFLIIRVSHIKWLRNLRHSTSQGWANCQPFKSPRTWKTSVSAGGRCLIMEVDRGPTRPPTTSSRLHPTFSGWCFGTCGIIYWE